MQRIGSDQCGAAFWLPSLNLLYVFQGHCSNNSKQLANRDWDCLPVKCSSSILWVNIQPLCYLFILLIFQIPHKAYIFLLCPPLVTFNDSMSAISGAPWKSMPSLLLMPGLYPTPTLSCGRYCHFLLTFILWEQDPSALGSGGSKKVVRMGWLKQGHWRPSFRAFIPVSVCQVICMSLLLKSVWHGAPD